MRLEFVSLPENVGLARVTVAAFAAQLDLLVNELEEIKVAVSEAVSNAIVHGYGGRKDGSVRVTANRYAEGIEITIADEGKGMPPPELSRVRNGKEEHPGLGFVFMRTFMDSVEVESEEGKGTRVKMFKKLASLSSQTVEEK